MSSRSRKPRRNRGAAAAAGRRSTPHPPTANAAAPLARCRVIVDRNGRATYERAFLDEARAGRLFAALCAGATWSQEYLTLFGKRIAFPRLTAWYGDPGASYKYSGVRYEPLPWLPELLDVRAALEAHAGVRFNSVLLNWYRDGNDSMGWHADDEPELGPQPVIASLSLGAGRRFDVKPRGGGATIGLELGHGSLLMMSGALQRGWVHRIPKQPRVAEARINLTFRDTGERSA